MRPILLFLFVFSTFPGVSRAAEPVVFKYVAITGTPTVVVKETREMNMAMDVASNGQPVMSMKQQNQSSREITIAVTSWSDTERAATFTYGDNGEMDMQTNPQAPAPDVKSRPDATANKSYRVSWTKEGANLVIENTKATGVSSDERSRIDKDWANLTRSEPSDFHALVVGQPIQIGQKMDVEPDVIAKHMEFDGSVKLTKSDIVLAKTLTQAGREFGEFQITLVFVDEKVEEADKMTTNMEMTGTFLVPLAGAHVHSGGLKGPMTITGESQRGGQTLTMSGTGTVSMTQSVVVTP